MGFHDRPVLPRGVRTGSRSSTGVIGVPLPRVAKSRVNSPPVTTMVHGVVDIEVALGVGDAGATAYYSS